MDQTKIQFLVIDTFNKADSLFRYMSELTNYRIFSPRNISALAISLKYGRRVDLVILEPMVSKSFITNKENDERIIEIRFSNQILDMIEETYRNMIRRPKIIILSTLSEEELYMKGFPRIQKCIFLQKTILPEDLVKKIDELF